MGESESMQVHEENLHLEQAAELIRLVPDYPSPGVLFRDIGPLLADAGALGAVVQALGSKYEFDLVAGVEARGFLLAAAVAHARGTGVAGLRKPGKLPVVADRIDYDLEYGSASLELPGDTLAPGQRVLVVDDVLATGGTLGAACELVTNAGAKVVAAAVVLEISALRGRDRTDEAVQALFTV
jgi:adenine phosphoribosyltransferase